MVGSSSAAQARPPSLDPEIYPALTTLTSPSSSSSSNLTTSSSSPDSPETSSASPSRPRPAPPSRARSANSLPSLRDYPCTIHDLQTLPARDHTHPCCPPAPIYVLAADGSHLYLLDPSKPVNEDPPPYVPFGERETGRARAATFAGRTLHPASQRGLRTDPAAAHRGQGGHHPNTRESGRPGSSLSPSPRSPIRLPSPSWGQRQYRTFSDALPHTDVDSERGDGGEPVARTFHEMLRGIIYGDADGAIALPLTEDDIPRTSSWRRYWAPLSSPTHWWAVLHLLAINFPFNLLLWPPLLVGTLVGTALLITLPVGAVVWWLTLIIARWGAREELGLQSRFHGRGRRPRPIFYRLREVHPSTSGDGVELVWDTRFLNNSWAMVSQACEWR